jgi:hypothetical protein
MNISLWKKNLPYLFSREYNRQHNNNPNLLESGSSSMECLVCSDNKRDTMFQPCSHIVTCHSCANRVKKCLLCKENVQTRIKVKTICFFILIEIWALNCRLNNVKYVRNEKLGLCINHVDI